MVISISISYENKDGPQERFDRFNRLSEAIEWLEANEADIEKEETNIVELE